MSTEQTPPHNSQEPEAHTIKHTGITHFFKAAGYSMQGLKSAFRYEAAFRHDLSLTVILIILAFILGHTAIETALLVACALLILVVELLNSGIEAVVDRIGSEYHELAGRAKDLGSAAVFVTLVMNGLVWAIVLFL